MKRHLVVLFMPVVLVFSSQYSRNVQAEPLNKYVGSETTRIAWVWTPEYAKRFNLPENESQLKDGPIKAIGLRVSRVESAGQPARYWCSIELITDGTQNFLSYGIPFHTNQLYEQVDLIPGLISLNDEDGRRAIKERLEGGGFPAYLGFLHEDKKKGRYISTRYRLFRKDFLAGLQYVSFKTGCTYDFPQNGFKLVLFVAHADYREKGRIYEEPKSYRIEIPNRLVNHMQDDLTKANATNAEYVKIFDEQYKSRKK